jgi:ATP-dependent protease ClpP protease subunit
VTTKQLQNRRRNRFWGEKDIPKSKAEFFNAVTTPAPSGDGTVATIRIYGPIDSWGGFWGVSTKDVGGVLDALSDSVTQIILRINSPGGEVFEGIAILNLLRAHRASVTAVVDGLAASAASVIAAGCDETVMSPGTQLMIHSPWSFAGGNAADLRKSAAVLDSIESSLIEVYAAKAGEKDWPALLAAETWLNAAQAVEFGLADRAAVVPDAGESVTVSDDDLEVITLDDDDIEDVAARAQVIRFPERAAARAQMPPSASAPGSPTEKETAMPDLTTTIRARLGLLDPAVSDDVIVAALDEALAERAEPTTSAPEGTVLMDAAALADLQAAANEGRQALAQQATARREAIVDAALADGRIAPASRAAWLTQLEANEEGAASLIASLTPNTIPVAELGENAEPTADQSLYASAWGTDTKGA